MSENTMPRALRADEIEIKVKKITGKGIIALLYKTASVDMDILDETYGAENWQTDYKEIKGNLYCGIAVNNNWKWDCGIESREDEEGNQKKGEASDAFKRAGFRWGIGRELYSSPFIFIGADKCSITKNKAGNDACYDEFAVEKILYDDNRKISAISVINTTKHSRAFVWTKEPANEK